jgi:hypothetical protein
MGEKEVNRLMRKKILWMLFLVPLVLSLVPALVSAQPPYLYVDPSFTWCEPGKDFSVGIAISDIGAEYLWAYQLELTINPDVLRPIRWENGPFLESAGGDAGFVEGLGYDETTGKIALFGGYIVDPEIPDAPEGGGVLAIVTFEVLALGDSDIIIGYNDLIDMKNEYIGTDPPEHGEAHSEYGPELYLRRRGSHGGGAWPEWHVGLVGAEQTLYARIRNYGTVGAWVVVVFEVKSASLPTQYYYSTEAWIEPRQAGDNSQPGDVVVSATFPAGTPGHFEVKGKLFSIAGPFVSYFYWGHSWIALGGEGDTRDTIAAKYKVVT